MTKVSFRHASRNTSIYKRFNCLTSHEQTRLVGLRKQKYRALLLLALGKGKIKEDILKKYLLFILTQILAITVDQSAFIHRPVLHAVCKEFLED
jgi:hypothetical protein